MVGKQREAPIQKAGRGAQKRKCSKRQRMQMRKTRTGQPSGNNPVVRAGPSLWLQPGTRGGSGRDCKGGGNKKDVVGGVISHVHAARCISVGNLLSALYRSSGPVTHARSSRVRSFDIPTGCLLRRYGVALDRPMHNALTRKQESIQQIQVRVQVIVRACEETYQWLNWQNSPGNKRITFLHVQSESCGWQTAWLSSLLGTCCHK
jgi:hypothetical protein